MRAVFIGVDTPLGAAIVEPAILIGLPVEIVVNFAIDLETVLEIGQNFEFESILAILEEQAAQRPPLGVKEHIAIALAGVVNDDGLHRAGFLLFGR